MKCPFCAEEIQPDAKKCRFCGEWLESSAAPAVSDVAQEPIEAATPKQKKQITDGQIVGLLFVAIFGFVWVMSSSKSSTSPAAQQKPDAFEMRATELGEEGTLRGVPLEGGGRSTLVALGKTEADFDAFIKAQTAGDADGIGELDKAGRIFTIPSGKMRGKKIDSNWSGAVQVRILDGERAGESGWTYVECLEKS